MRRILHLAGFLALLILLSACSAPVSRMAMQEKTAIDTATGMIWMKNANLANKPLPWRADDNVYAFIQNLNKSTFAGYADWRVPTRDEMNDLLKYAKKVGKYKVEKVETWPYQALRKLGFEDVKDYGYWTSTRESSSEMYIADFATGKVTVKPEDKPYYLWPVRGGR
ncbi:MAG: DUF1566 domain-containing protein [Desulfuromonadales bacterium]|nr:DUF1566 domain-containing protein [Desulfuromonadales bacterium]